jgi:hypothetical protein
VHEYSHCLFTIQDALERVSRGEGHIDDTFDPADQDADDARMVDPQLWFGEEDCKAFIHHNHDLRALEGVFLALTDTIPVLKPVLGYRIGRIAFPEELKTRLEELRGSTLQP